jgi:hypothetical protein
MSGSRRNVAAGRRQAPRALRVALLCTFALVVLSVPTATSGEQATVQARSTPTTVAAARPPADRTRLWSTDVEKGNLADWYAPERCACPRGNFGGGEYNSGNADSRASRDVAHSGRWAVKLVQRGGGTRLFRWRESHRHSKAYYSVWLLFPRQYTARAGWWNVFQWKSKSPSGASEPFWVINVLNRADGSMHLRLFDSRKRVSYPQSLGNLPVNRWVHLEAFLSQSAGGTGRIIVWQDGVKLWDLSDITTKFPDGDQEWSVNNYSDAVQPQPTVIYADDARIGRARVKGRR